MRDVIILDLMMPEMDGFQLVAALQQHPQWRRIPVVVVTALDLSATPALWKRVCVVNRHALFPRQITLRCLQLSNGLSGRDYPPTFLNIY